MRCELEAELRPIGKVVLPVETWSPATADESQVYPYIDISSVSSATRSIVGATPIKPANAPSRARQLVQPGDILVSTVRPNLNAVAVVPARYPIAIASTGFCVLRPNPEVVDQSYLFHWLTSPAFVADMVSKATGASYPAVSDRIVKSSLMPYCSPSEQRRIAAILDKADAIRRKRQQALVAMEQLIGATFRKMFPPSTASNRKEFGDLVASTKLGLVRGTSEIGTERKHCYLKMDAISPSGFLNLARSVRVDASADELKEYLLEHGDFLFNTRNARDLVGKSSLFLGEDEYLFNNNILRVRFASTVDPFYMWQYFQTPAAKQQLEQRKSGTTSVFAIYYKDLATLQVPVPPVEQQLRFRAAVTALLNARDRELQAIASSNRLFGCLSQQFFLSKLDSGS